MDIQERIEYWHKEICPELSVTDFVHKYNLSNVDEWYDELDYSLQLAKDNLVVRQQFLQNKRHTYNKISEWYQKFKRHDANLTKEGFIETHGFNFKKHYIFLCT